LKEKREKGLFFKCNKEWNLSHKNGGPKLFVIEEVGEEDEG
jgi:hypothetical protein